jgi:hypothetical protein
MATRLKIEKRGDEIIPLEMHFFVDSLLLVIRGEDFFLISSPLFLICIIGQNRQKFKVHKKSRQNCVPHFRTPTKMAATAELNLT